MEQAMGIIKLRKKRPVIIKCIETGEVATLPEWVARISKQAPFLDSDAMGIYRNIYSATLKKCKSLGLTWERVEVAE